MKYAIMTLLTTLSLASTYPRAMEIVDIDKANDIAVCVDVTGMEWEFTEPEDLEIGDIVICTMYDKGTKNTIVDDEIVDVRWSGYWIEGNSIMSPTRR